MKAPHGYEAIARFVGWDAFLAQHRGATGKALEAAVKAEWEPRMVLVKAPPGCSFFYDANVNGVADPGEASRGVRVHPMIADETAALLLDIADAHLWRFVESCAGGYAYRLQKGSFTKFSCHGLGLAIDFDPKRNGWKVDPSLTALGTEPGRGVVRIFERRGWRWGGEFPTPDAMHGQFATGY